MIVQLTIHTIGGILWTTAYLLIAWHSHRDKTYGMPLAAIAANISWEFHTTFISPPSYPSETLANAERTISITWILIDFVILGYALRYGPREFPRLSRTMFYGMFLGLFIAVGGSDILISEEFNDAYGIRAAFLQTVMMSLLFLAMLYSRQSLRGQSLGIALAKMGGTICASLGIYLRPPDPIYHDSVLLPFLYVTILVIDLIYVIAVYRVRQRERAATQPDSERPANAYA